MFASGWPVEYDEQGISRIWFQIQADTFMQASIFLARRHLMAALSHVPKLLSLQKVINGCKVNNWACINFSRSVQETTARGFCQELAQMCQISGMVNLGRLKIDIFGLFYTTFLSIYCQTYLIEFHWFMAGVQP